MVDQVVSQKTEHKGTKGKFLLVVAPFYKHISTSLTQGALDVLVRAGYEVEVVSVGGALEIPMAISYASQSKEDYVGYVALGCVIRGETYHFEVVSLESARALQEVALKQNLTIGNGIITVESEKQALARSEGTKNKGAEAAQAALSVLALKKRFLG